MGVCVELRVRRGRRSCGALGIMTARVATASIIRSNGRSGHGGSCMSCGSVGPSILSRPSTGPPSRHWTAGFGPPGPLRGARRAHRLPAAGRCSDSADRTDVAGSREAPRSLHSAHRPDGRRSWRRSGPSPFEAPAEVAPGGRTDLRQGGSRDEGQDEQEDGRHGEAEAHGDGLGDLVAVGLGLWSQRIGHYW
jgi:hypothetical protein